MIIVYTKKDLINACNEYKKDGKKIGLVPTMGYLHEGHLSLAKESVSNNDITVMSIFVNPVQFGPNEDFEKYPRDTERDIKLAESVGVDVLFCPDAGEMYVEEYATYVNVEGSVTECLCGEKRPGHFRGVATVVCKLFNLVRPDNSYFGQKDYQQTRVINRMIEDLDIQTNIVICPIVRECDGLAKSSRNVYLTEKQRIEAVILSKSLELFRKIAVKGAETEKICSQLSEFIVSHAECKIDYVEIRNGESLEKLDIVDGKVVLALAVYFGATRLIDNCVIDL